MCLHQLPAPAHAPTLSPGPRLTWDLSITLPDTTFLPQPKCGIQWSSHTIVPLPSTLSRHPLPVRLSCPCWHWSSWFSWAAGASPSTGLPFLIPSALGFPSDPSFWYRSINQTILVSLPERCHFFHLLPSSSTHSPQAAPQPGKSSPFFWGSAYSFTLQEPCSDVSFTS